MKIIDYEKLLNMSFDHELINMISTLHGYRGKEELFRLTHPEVLDKLTRVAKIQSTAASNSLEGIRTTNNRLNDLMADKTTPQNRDEAEITGYRDVLALIHDSHDAIDISVNHILQLHKNMYTYLPPTHGGKFKMADNIIQELDADGNKRTRFEPVRAYLTPEYMNKLVEQYNYIIGNTPLDPLLLMPVFILDFLCIHPFSDGNGRLSRLLTLLLLYKNGFYVGKYISIEKIIEDTKISYYDTLQTSSAFWHNDTNDFLPFTKYYLGVLIAAYKELEERYILTRDSSISTDDRILNYIKTSFSPTTKRELVDKMADVSETTIERYLSKLLKDGKIKKVGSGRGTKYTKS